MSGMSNMFLGASSGGINLTFNINIIKTSTSTGVKNAAFNLAADGSATAQSSGINNWYTPTTTGVGSFWSVRFTNNTISNTTASWTSGTWYALTSGQNFTVQNSAANLEGTGNASIAFSPDSGTTVIGSGSLTWDVGYTP